MLGQYHHNRCPPLMVRFLSVRYRYAFINEYKQLTNHYRLRITYVEHLSPEKYLPSKCTHDMRNLSCSLRNIESIDEIEYVEIFGHSRNFIDRNELDLLNLKHILYFLPHMHMK